MKFMNRAFALVAILGMAMVSVSAQAQTAHSLLAGSGGQSQIGGGLPLPIQIFGGGTNMATAGTFPPLLIPPAPELNLVQDAAGGILVPASFIEQIATTVLMAPVIAANPAVFQVNTAIDFAWPSTKANFAPGGGPVATAGTAGIFAPAAGPAGGNVTYTNSGASFGGPALFALGNGAPSAGGAIPGDPVTVYINFMAQLPATATGAALVGANLVGVAGQTVAAATVSTPGVQADPGFMGGAFGPAGTVLASVQCGAPCPGLMNQVLGDKGYPWTTGKITVSAPNAVPAEIFFLSGDDTRVGGVGDGTISMVSATVSNRSLSGPNANRAWVSLVLPEPTALAGAAGAFLMLGACHTVVRRRARR